MSSQHCGNPCQSPELTHLLGLPPRVLNPRTQRAPEPSFIGRGGQPPAQQCPTVSPPLFLLPKAVGPKPCEGAPFCGQPLRPPPGNRDPGNNSVLFPQDPLFPLFISSKVSAAHTHMCMQIHMHTNTCACTHPHAYACPFAKSYTYTNMYLHIRAHTHCSPCSLMVPTVCPFLLGPRSAFMLLRCWEAGSVSFWVPLEFWGRHLLQLGPLHAFSEGLEFKHCLKQVWGWGELGNLLGPQAGECNTLLCSKNTL